MGLVENTHAHLWQHMQRSWQQLLFSMSSVHPQVSLDASHRLHLIVAAGLNGVGDADERRKLLVVDGHCLGSCACVRLCVGHYHADNLRAVRVRR